MKHKMHPDLAKGQKRPCKLNFRMPKALVESKITDIKSSSLSDPSSVALCFIDYAEFFFFFALASYICDVTFFPSYVSFFPRIFEVWPFSRRDADRRLANLSRQGLGGLHLLAQIKLSEDLPPYRALATPRSKERVQSQKISYTRARELIKDVLEILPDGSRISVYSLSAGGVTSAANAGVAGRFSKRHVCWASENAKNGYVKDDFNYCLSVTKSLGF